MTDRPFEHELVVGTRDMGDSHVDNAVFPAYVARVRQAFLRETVPRFEAYDRHVARLELDYHAELFAGDRVTGTVEVADIGETSLTTEVTLACDGTRVAMGRTVLVVVDPASGDPTRVPDAWRAALE
ncbi:acyl-CoA thioesterase [Natronomonas marina]|uniref:acyl-CoA thioesterase n=1 Tax=Natronomonas marina TaxID=2961939 RepID=UPI0020C9DFA7|nr:thioesterase family protein [Natronomonas marina]